MTRANEYVIYKYFRNARGELVRTLVKNFSDKNEATAFIRSYERLSLLSYPKGVIGYNGLELGHKELGELLEETIPRATSSVDVYILLEVGKFGSIMRVDDFLSVSNAKLKNLKKRIKSVRKERNTYKQKLQEIEQLLSNINYYYTKYDFPTDAQHYYLTGKVDLKKELMEIINKKP